MSRSATMKERPINMRADEVRAILAWRKTQFRREIWKQPDYVNKCGVPFYSDGGGPIDYRLSPFGAPGDRLWVREAFRLFDCQKECACYDSCLCSSHHGKPVFRATYPDDEGPWSPSVHMPRKFSRITLEVASVRVERLQDISEGEAQAEGFEPRGDQQCRQYTQGFIDFWQSINGPGSWDENPWVWVVEFRRLEVQP